MSKAIAMQALGAGFCALLSFALLLFLGRAMGPAQFGAYVSALSTAILGLILIEGGWPTLIYRETASPDCDTSQATRLLRLATAHVLTLSLGLLALVGLLWLISGAARWQILLPALACMAMVAMMNLASARLRGAGRFGMEAVWQSLGRLVSALLIVVWVLALGAAPAGVFIAWTVGLAGVLLLLGRHWLRLPQWQGLRAGYALALPFVAYDGLLAFLSKGDMAVLGWLRLASTDLSFYAACSRLNEAALLLFAPVGNVLLRQLRQADPVSRFRLTWQYAGLAMLAGGLIWAVASLVAMPLMAMLFGASFRAAGSLLPWVLATLPLLLPSLVFCIGMLAKHRERGAVWRLALAAVLLLLGLALGSHWDAARGAAIGAVIAQASLLLLCASASWHAAKDRIG